MANTLSASIVIHHLDITELEATLVCLNSAVNELIARTPVRFSKLTIVDNGKNSSSLESFIRSKAHQLSVDISILQNQKNLGFGSAHNSAIKLSQSSFHLILNPDAELQIHALAEGVLHLLNHPNTVIVGAQGTDIAGKPLFLSKRYPALFDLLLRGLDSDRLNRRYEGRLAHYECRDLDGDHPYRVPIISGCVMLCRTDVLHQINAFDPDFFLYFEDFDLCLRAGKVGNVIFLPAMKVLHHGGNTAKKSIFHIFHFARSAFRFYRKHGFRLF